MAGKSVLRPSTALSLSNNTAPPPSGENQISDCSMNLAWMRHYSLEDEEEERSRGFSTKLTLYNDPFKIKKTLKQSDLGNHSRLMLSVKSVMKHILPFVSEEFASNIKTAQGEQVRIWDCDTHTEHRLIFKQFSQSSKSYVLNGGWRKDFVRRRNLHKKDEVGFFRDPSQSMFYFKVLRRANNAN